MSGYSEEIMKTGPSMKKPGDVNQGEEVIQVCLELDGAENRGAALRFF
jgi:hypothetical protein